MIQPSVRLSAVQRFLHAEASGGIVLLVAAALAIVWANSPASESYQDLWHAKLTFDLAFTRVEEDLQHLVNDGLMTLFFFVVGLEIKREVLRGELSSPQRAALPIAGALGGMIIPATLYALVNARGDGASGWGIPMATDIAFAVGVLALVGPRIPTSLKVFLLALAIVDDLGAIIVIAVFYTENIALEPLAWGAVVVAVILGARMAGVKSILFYVIPGMLLWLAVLESGIHATLAGVFLAMLTPAGPLRSREEYHRSLKQLVAELTAADERSDSEAEDIITGEIDRLTDNREPPLDRLEHALHPWASFVVVPLFALANGGLELSGDFLTSVASSPIALGVMLGLILGKPAGILFFSLVAVRLRLARLPETVSWQQIAGVGVLGGIGFTVAIFIAGLAFTSPTAVDEAKGSIFLASIISGVAGFALLRVRK